MGKENIKKNLYDQCMVFVKDKIATIQSAIKSAQDSSSDEKKSSMGDKYETTSAMMHLEIENQSFQLVEANKLLTTLHLIQPEEPRKRAELGAVVITSTAKYYISVSVGKLMVDKDTYFAISLSSPIGKVLLGATVGDKLSFQNKTIEIKEIY